MSFLAISSFSLHSALGPLRLERRLEDGSLGEFVIDFPRHLGLEEFAALARERVDVKAIELCQIQFDSADPARIERLRTALDQAGVRLLTLPIDVGDLGCGNAEWLADDEARILRWFEIAHRLGASFVRVNAGAPGAGIRPGGRPGLVDSLCRLGDAVGARGMKLLIENHGGTSSDPEFMLGLREDVGHHRLGILLDLGNFEPLVSLSHGRFANADIEDTGLDLEPLYTCIAALAPVASLVHAKSIDPASDGAPLPDVQRALAIVAGSGYRGPVSIEWEGHLGDPWERTAAIAAHVRAAFPHLQ